MLLVKLVTLQQIRTLLVLAGHGPLVPGIVTGEMSIIIKALLRLFQKQELIIILSATG